MEITIINANTDLGVTVDGSNLGPKILSNYFKNLKNVINIIEIDKNTTKKSKLKDDLAKNIDAVNDFNSNLYTAIIKAEEANYFPIIIGGDHSLSIGSALASINFYKNLGIIWIDAHLDYNTFETTITGNLHGLPLATINGLNKDLSFFHNGNYYKPENTVVVGYRSEEENKDKELNNIKKMGVKVFTTEDIRVFGIESVIKEAFQLATKNTKGVHISYDLDVIDPIAAPGVSIKENNGITEEEAYLIRDEILKYKNNIKSLDLVEFNPINDVDMKTETIAKNILNKIIKSKS